ncbi:MAG TPA: two-component regulator propeller domain-containing protein [Rhodothermales bacterium]|nr:two-component regulator propeller domain-containing protein [Rhodothermales bacterium]
MVVLGGCCLRVGIAQSVDAGFDTTKIHTDQLRFRQLSTADGLSQNFVTALVQDRQGLLWVGTKGGLNRYDGYTFEVFKHDLQDTTTLSGNIISKVLEDQHGYLWVTNNNGLDRLDPRSGIVERLATWAEPLMEDRRGTLWVRDAQGRLHHLLSSPSKGAPLEPVAMIPGQVMAACEDLQGHLWFASKQEDALFLYRYDPFQDRVTAYPLSDSPLPITALYPAYDGHIWVTGQNQLGVFDAATEDYSIIAERGYRLHSIPDQDHKIWAVSMGDVAVLDVRTRALKSLALPLVQHMPGPIEVDRSGGVWIGTILGGVYYYSPYARPFQNLARQTDTPLDLADDVVLGLHEATDGTLWVGTLQGGLYHLSANFEILRHYPYDPLSSSCSSPVWDVYEDHAGRLWIGTSGGLCFIDPHSGVIEQAWVSKTGSRVVEAIREDADGTLWLALYDAGFARYDPATGRVKQYRRFRRGFISAHTVHVDGAGQVWLGTFGRVLIRFDPIAETFTSYPYRTDAAPGAHGREVWDIYEDETGALWLATDLGLSRFDPSTETFQHYTEHDGLPSSTVFSILPGDEGRLWLGTTHGLVVFDASAPSDQAFTTFDAADGLHNVEFNRRAAVRLRHGAFLFGGTQGLTLFDPEAIHTNPHPPPVVLRQFEKTGQNGVETLAIAGQDALTLGPDVQAFRFTFVALNYATPGRTHYRYRLEPFETHWTDAGTDRTATCTNIPPGTYTFRTKAASSDGRWSEESASVRLTILPSFWQTWWFRMLVGAFAAALLYTAYRYRVRHLLQVQQMRLRIAADLHDDIGAGLGSIALMSDMLRTHNSLGERDRGQIAEIGLAAREMATELREIVWFISPERDRLVDLLMRLRQETPRLLGSLSYSFQGPETVSDHALDMSFRRNVLLVYKEMLHNVARHARAMHVDIEVVQQNGTLTVRVADDGVGCNGAVGSGHGMSNMRRRAAQLKGCLAVESVPGEGTRVTLSVPMP